MIKSALKPQIIELLQRHGPMTTRQLADKLDCTPNACGLVMRSSSQFHVTAWTQTGQCVWAFGIGEHAPRPKRDKATETQEQRDQWKANAMARDQARLEQRYVQHRVWGI